MIRVPLMKDYSHDVKAMVAANPDAGLIYICNPNNPTGTITKKSDIEWAIANKPKGSVIMVDEAYYHLAGIPPLSDAVADDKDVIILRTFSKIYGMAGIRAGVAIGRPDLLQKSRAFMAGALPTTAMAAATASLKNKTLVPERRKIRRSSARRTSRSSKSTVTIPFPRCRISSWSTPAVPAKMSSPPSARRRSTSAARGRFGPPPSASPSAPRTRWRSSRPPGSK